MAGIAAVPGLYRAQTTADSARIPVRVMSLSSGTVNSPRARPGDLVSARALVTGGIQTAMARPAVRSQPLSAADPGSRRVAGRFFRLAGLAGALILLVSGCGSAAPASPDHAPGGVVVLARSLPRVGMVLVSARGYALYMFVPDRRRHVTCTGYCADTWPPVRIGPAGAPLAGPGARQRLLSADPDPAGGRVVTYNGWPLYTYTSDVQPGQTTGQGIDLNGGAWYLMRPSGRPLVAAPP